MGTGARPIQEQLRDQIQKYGAEFPHYEAYAKALNRVLEQGCMPAIPEVIVQARPKSISSFAEKCVRKFVKYPDAVHDMTDLCGARIIVQTLGWLNCRCNRWCSIAGRICGGANRARRPRVRRERLTDRAFARAVDALLSQLRVK